MELTDINYENGITEEEYEELVDKIKSIAEDNDEPIKTIDDLVANLRMFGLNEFYGETYRNILEYANVGVDKDIARIDSAKTPKHHLQAKAGEVLAMDAQRRLLESQS